MTDSLQQLDVLAIGAHPDDVEISTGGTLVKLSALGYQVGILDLTRGESGTRGTPEIRAQEAAQAARILGLAVRENLDLGDARVWPLEEARTRVVRVLRRLRPRLVLTHYWEDPHPDHVQASVVVRQASHLAGLTHYDGDGGLVRWRPSAVAHFLFPRTTLPSFIVDISEHAERKWDAIRCHASQFYDPQSRAPSSRVSTRRFLEEIESRDRYFGSLIGVDRGEPILVQEALNVADPVALLTRSMNMYS